MTLQARVYKEPPDITRIVVDMAWWLDVNEIITQIVSSEVIQGMSGWSEAPYPPPDSPPPYDPTPLILREVLLDATHRQLIIFVEFGTSGVAYTLQFILDGSTNRRITFEVGVQVTGVPPEQPMPLPPLPPGAGQQPGDRYLNILGGMMEGELYLFHDPLYPTEAATKAYVDGVVAGAAPGGSFMPISGGTFTGPVHMGSSLLTLSQATPVGQFEAVAKWYVDSKAANAGVTMFNTRVGAITLVTKDVTDAGGAPVASPTFTGTPAAPTAAPGTQTTQLATTAFVTSAIVASTTGVSTFNGRSGAVTFLSADISSVGGALLSSPTFSGNPTAPTPAPGDNDTSIATTAFVTDAVNTVSTKGVVSFNTRVGAVTLTTQDVIDVGGAPLANPTFTGVPAGPTAAPGTQTTQLATTEFVTSAVVASTTGVSTFNGRSGAVTLTTQDVTDVGGALVASPTFTGTPAAPTAPANTDTTQLATTAFVKQAMAITGSYLPLTGGTLSGGLNISYATPRFFLNNTAGAVDSRAYDFSIVNHELIGRAISDNGVLVRPWITVTRYPGSEVLLEKVTFGAGVHAPTIFADTDVVVGRNLTCQAMNNSTGKFIVNDNNGYYLARDPANRTWEFVEASVATFRIGPTGDAQAAQSIQAGAGFYPGPDVNFRIFSGAGLYLIQYTPQYNWYFTTAINALTYASGGGTNWQFNGSDWSSVNFAGAVGGLGSFVTVSDERSKRDITDAQHGLATILGIRPIVFHRWNPATKVRAERPEIGFSAQQIRTVLPEAVTDMDPPDAAWRDLVGDGKIMGVRTDPIVAALVNAVRELQEQIHQLRSRK